LIGIEKWKSHEKEGKNMRNLLVYFMSAFIFTPQTRMEFKKKYLKRKKYIPTFSMCDTICRKMSLLKNDDIYTLPIGIKLYCPFYPWDVIQRHIVNTSSFFESDILTNLEKYIPTNSVILDVGANIGNHSIFWATIGKASVVHAFEPVPETYKILCKNIEINSISKVVTPHNIGLGKKQSAAVIDFHASDNIGGTSIKESNILNKYVMRVDCLDNMDLKLKKIDFIKIDVEGFEIDVLMGMLKTLEKYRPIVFIESFLPGMHEYLPCNGNEVLDMFKSLKYKSPISYPDGNWLFLP
jgi:FkbM family methyltransferase